MIGLLLFLLSLVLIVWLSIIFRRREREKFINAAEDETVLLETFKSELGTEAVPAEPEFDPLIARAQHYLASRSAKSPLPISTINPEAEITQQGSYALKDIVLSESHRHLMQILDRLLGGEYRLFVHFPLAGFLKSSPIDIQGKTISFLICDRHHFRAVAGIELQTSDTTDYLQELFDEIRIPLLHFDKGTELSEAEVRRKLHFLKAEQGAEQGEASTPHCPKCDAEMLKRKATNGKSVGKRFWVCTHFPKCKGLLAIK